VRLDFGGQTHVAGGCGPSEIALTHPRNRSAIIADLTVSAGSVATSGNSERAIDVDGIRHGHLIDPRTGRPAPDFGAVTVLASDPVAADCVATALYVMGPERGSEWLRSEPGIEAVFAVPRGNGVQLLVSEGLAGRITVHDPGVEVRTFGRNGDASLHPAHLVTASGRSASVHQPAGGG
jgi:thiamine biosynthesis lipoprotein